MPPAGMPGQGGEGPIKVAITLPASDFTVNAGSVLQTIDGFGASDRDTGTLTTGQLDLLFTTSSGIGLSLLRASIEPTGAYSSDPANAQGAVSRGAKVWAAPWTPDPTWKSNGSNVGGTLNSGHYTDWANRLAAFVTMMATTYSVVIYAISAQNEPDSTVSFDSCQYSIAQMLAFVKVLGPILAALSPAPLLMAAETEQWSTCWTYGDVLLGDVTAAPMIGIIGVHDYGYATTTHAAVTPKFWETEVSSFEATDPSIANALTVASWIHRALTVGNVGAWHYWNISGLNDNQDLLPSGSLTKRLFALGQWSKFIRPGWVRVATSGSVSGLSVSAFKNASTGATAIVCVNASGGTISTSFTLSGQSASSIAPYVTTDTTLNTIGTDGNLSLGCVAHSIPTSIVPTAGVYFVASVPVGVTTFVGSP